MYKQYKIHYDEETKKYIDKKNLLKYANALTNEGYRDKRFTLYGFNYFDPMNILKA